MSTALSVVIPVYNSEPILPELVRRIGAVLPSIAHDFELVLVNDGSRDGSWRAIARLAAEHPWIRGIDLMRNYGQHAAVLCGLRAARFGTVVTMDDDLQNPPEEIPRLLERLEAGAQVVYGTPRAERHGLWRDLASQATKLVLQNAMGAETARSISPFRALRREICDAFSGYNGPFVNIDVLLTWGASRFASVAVDHRPRAVGPSNYTFTKLVRHAVNMITGFSTLPLRLASVVGFAFAAFGVVVLVYVVGRYLLLGYSVAGFPFLASIIAIFSGVQLFAMGIFGEYLARMYSRAIGQPAYQVRETMSEADTVRR
jgi:glycosyltransferase involved in cell wall biosynthesis